MQRTAPDPQREPDPDPPVGLPVLPDLAAHLSAAAGRTEPEPTGGSLRLRTAACGYWERRGLVTAPDRVLAAPGAPALLLALYAAADGAVVLPRPCSEWYAPPARLLGRPVHLAPVPAESGGVPDPFALLETVRRARMHGDTPRVLVLSVADDPTGTCPAARTAARGLRGGGARRACGSSATRSRRDLLHDPHDTVVLSPAEMLPGEVVVLTDLRATLVPASWPAALARFPRPPTAAPLLRTAALDALTAPRTSASRAARLRRHPCARRTRGRTRQDGHRRPGVRHARRGAPPHPHRGRRRLPPAALRQPSLRRLRPAAPAPGRPRHHRIPRAGAGVGALGGTRRTPLRRRRRAPCGSGSAAEALLGADTRAAATCPGRARPPGTPAPHRGVDRPVARAGRAHAGGR